METGHERRDVGESEGSLLDLACYMHALYKGMI